MDCEAYVVPNYTHYEGEDSGEEVDPGDASLIETLARCERFLGTRIVVVICCLGVLGNVLNLLALTRRSLVAQMGKMEKSSTAGLVGLALSDLLFCLINLPNASVDYEAAHWFTLSFDAFYRIYGTSVLNIFVVSSTWLTVVMAISRYIAICYPIHARMIVDMKFAAGSMVAVFIGAILLNLPRFWHYKLTCKYLTPDQQLIYPHSEPKWYELHPGVLNRASAGWRAYIIVYFIFAVLIPLLTLAFCNVYLVRALRQSAKMRSQMMRRDQESSDATRVVTLTLTVIVVANILLVAPCEIFTFFDQIVNEDIVNVKTHAIYNFVVSILNVLQVISFSFNFVLYILINTRFRRAIKDIFTCKKGSTDRASRMSYSSMTQQTSVPLTRITNHDTKDSGEQY
ncbi:hypothetical protein CAPTEDRAFT_186466 [Capitella teleta]|uniref:G-protein coupled receptors family 1 profile domain-containing protein n=1 Tax=Capitella teleta TaxID=283909 RepID=R7TEN6_CAPTE|nr:hypothetical protein CAPTEDRAFT_186466 [Capitella teleta]|eukprot:ELT89937.1 hypothetical protein CAPTEDRAFT_186466 [Capitella teleta]